MNAIFTLRAKMLQFLQTYLHFMVYEVIVPQWAAFKQSIHTVLQFLFFSFLFFLWNSLLILS